MQKLGFCIYADFECINKKVDDSERVDEEHLNSKGSSTTYKTNHAVSGYTFYSCSDYFPSNVQTYRGPDAGEVFLRNIQEEKERLLEFPFTPMVVIATLLRTLDGVTCPLIDVSGRFLADVPANF